LNTRKGEIDVATHEARGLGQHVAGAFEFEADDEVARFLDLHHEHAGAEGVRRAAGDDERVARADRMGSKHASIAASPGVTMYSRRRSGVGGRWKPT
jgi:hypothetical protein